MWSPKVVEPDGKLRDVSLCIYCNGPIDELRPVNECAGDCGAYICLACYHKAVAWSSTGKPLCRPCFRSAFRDISTPHPPHHNNPEDS